MQKQFQRKIAGEAMMMAFGAHIAPLLGAGDVLALSGGLGSGKTTLARGIIGALCRSQTRIPSPTFTLVEIYQAHIPIWHVDLYRLDTQAEIAELGLSDALDQAALIIEWPEKMGDALPKTRLDVRIAPIDDFRARLAILTARGKTWEDRVHELNS